MHDPFFKRLLLNLLVLLILGEGRVTAAPRSFTRPQDQNVTNATLHAAGNSTELGVLVPGPFEIKIENALRYLRQRGADDRYEMWKISIFNGESPPTSLLHRFDAWTVTMVDLDLLDILATGSFHSSPWLFYRPEWPQTVVYPWDWSDRRISFVEAYRRIEAQGLVRNWDTIEMSVCPPSPLVTMAGIVRGEPCFLFWGARDGDWEKVTMVGAYSGAVFDSDPDFLLPDFPRNELRWVMPGNATM